MTAWPWLFAGVALGLVNILLLKVNLDRVAFRQGDKTWLWLGAGMVVRLVLVAALLVLAVRQGFAQALFAFMGFWMVRWPLLYWLDKRSKPK